MSDTKLQHSNPHLGAWIQEMAELAKPDRIVMCDGSKEQKRALQAQCVADGSLIELNQEKLPGCYLARSDKDDVARTEHLTYICSPTQEEAGPTNNWLAPDEAYAKLRALTAGGMKGRTMYVAPYLMGPVGSPYAKVGVELTDAPHVVLNLNTMTAIGKTALDVIGRSANFNMGMHALLDCNPDRRMICHFPQSNAVWSVGSGFGGNSILPKKCFALRIASTLGRKEGWLAEHMLILGVEDPKGRITYVAAAFPSQCGKTNFAMMTPPARFNGWRIWTVGDDIAWMHPKLGRLWAINPEAGYFGVAPGTSSRTNPTAMRTIARDTLYTNVALTADGDVWWEGKDEAPPDGLIDWQGRPWSAGGTEKAAHPNARFTAPMRNNPMQSPMSERPEGVPISAIIFGGRRADTVPLVLQSFDWTHGVFMGATLRSEKTAAATGTTGELRPDPFAMLPFCGYHIGDYFAHWLDMQKHLEMPPKIFTVNWFRKDGDAFLWPGYGENMRVLRWIVERSHVERGAAETPVGWVPRVGDLDLSDLNIPADKVRAASHVDIDEWKHELGGLDEFFAKVGDRLPRELTLQRDILRAKLDRLS